MADPQLEIGQGYDILELNNDLKLKLFHKESESNGCIYKSKL